MTVSTLVNIVRSGLVIVSVSTATYFGMVPEQAQAGGISKGDCELVGGTYSDGACTLPSN